MIVVGLTGSMGTGKTTVAKILKEHGIAVHDADATVHVLLESDLKTFQDIAEHFPNAIRNQKVDRKILREIVLSDSKKMSILEGLLHPQVEASQQNFLKKHQEMQTELVVLEIPLL